MKYRVKRFSIPLNTRTIEAKLRSMGYSDREIQVLTIELEKSPEQDLELLKKWVSGKLEIDDPKAFIEGWQKKELL